MLPDVPAIYMVVLFTVILRTLALGWLSFGIAETQTATNIPYETLGLEMVASFILLLIAIQKGYFLHLFFYLSQFAILALIIVQKMRF